MALDILLSSPLVAMAAIVCLIFPSVPPAIIRSVISVVIYSLNGKPYWTWPHISNEIEKRFPSGAHFNPPFSITAILRMFRVVASSTKIFPRNMFPCVRETVGFINGRYWRFVRPLSLKTTTAFGLLFVCGQQTCGSYISCGPTLTKAFENVLCFINKWSANERQSTRLVTNRKFCSHGAIPTIPGLGAIKK